MSDERKVPEGRVGRLFRLASLGARAGASMLVSRDGKSAADQAAEVLGTMRGLAAKIGQMASYVDGVVPDAQKDAWEASMKALRSAAPVSPFDAVRDTIEEDLGGKLEALFSDFEARPFASASIGQVHRAKMADGLVVAVKVQHPGVARAVESDLENANIIEAILRNLGADRLNSRGVLAEIKERFREELDYPLEAKRQTQFRELHAGDDTIVVPRVIAERCGPRVLTSELVRGGSIEDAAREPEALRRAWAETLWRYVFRGNLVGGMFNADPHPGNYLFQENGRVAFLDYGCIQPIDPSRVSIARRIHWAAVHRDEATFARSAAEMLQTRGGRYEKVATEYTRRCFDPVFDAPYRIDRAFSADLVRRMAEIAMEMRKASDAEFVPLPPGMVFINRLQAGFYSVLARLDAPADYAAVDREILAPFF